MGDTINSKPQSTPQTGDELPINRSGADFKISPEDFPDYLYTQEMLKGNPEGIYAQDTVDDFKWKIGQKGIELPTSTSPDIATPDLEENQYFFLAPSSTEFELRLPDNPPSGSQVYSGSPATNYFCIYARNSSSGSAGGLTFGSDYVELPGSKPYLKTGTNRVNIIHCWYSITGVVYYRVDNTGYAAGQLINFDTTITSAEILSSNTSAVTLFAAPGSGYFIDINRINAGFVNGTTPYDTNIDAGIFAASGITEILDIDLSSDPAIHLGPILGEIGQSISGLENGSITFSTASGNPANGDYDLRVWGTYRILAI